MARIRSVHPGQWTDHQFLSCSPFCRLLVLALRNEADDNGIFKWNLVEIKIKCLPLDNIHIEELMQEAIDNDQLKQFEVNNKKYGIIRNFQSWQRPKKPTFIYRAPTELMSVKLNEVWKEYRLNTKYFGSEVHLKDEEFPTPSPPVGESSSLKGGVVGEEYGKTRSEEGGRREEEGRKEEGGKKKGQNEFDRFWSVYPKKVKKKTSKEIWKRKKLDKKTDGLVTDVILRLENDKRWKAGYIPDPTTYLNQERWNDDCEWV